MKKLILIALLCAFVVTLTSCGVKNNEPDLLSDLSKQDLHLQEKLNVKSVEIIKRNTNKENKKDEVYVKAIADGFGVECDLQYKLVYNYYTDGGWVLDECIPEKTSEWCARPTRGVEAETVREEMQYLANNGYMYETYFQNVKYVSADSDYINGREAITMELSKSSPFRKFRAELTYNYRFNYEYIDNEFKWWWDRYYYEDDVYNILENDYSYLVGDWNEHGMSWKFRIEQLSEYDFKLSRYRDDSIHYTISFNLKNDAVRLTEYM